MLDGFLEQKPWVLVRCDEHGAASLANGLGAPVSVGRLLINRGITSSPAARRFLAPSLDHLHDPSLLPDLDTAVARVEQAVKSGEMIYVYGDYDVDGVTSTALLVRTLRALGATVRYRLPRRREGYDIKPFHVAEAAGVGAGLIVTCDCGSSASDAITEASKRGIDVIVTDHHEPPAELPRALAVVNPKRPGASYPFPELAGVGVALKFAQGLVRKLGHDEMSYVEKFLDLAAMGTVGDVVPLLDENRAMVKYGLNALVTTKKIGIRSLMEKAGLSGRMITANTLAFAIGPRINAVGRIDDPLTALRLLLTKDAQESQALADELERCNMLRKTEQESVQTQALEIARSKDLSTNRVLVLTGELWNPGIVGIVAGRIRETYCRPAILLSHDPKSGRCSGSGRSIDAFHLYNALLECSGLLEKFGGHSLAAGLTVKEENLAAFEEAINAVAEREIPDEELVPRIEYEAELSPHEITLELAKTLAGMEPFGTGNPEPLFVTRNQQIRQLQRVGDGTHLRMEVSSNGGPRLTCIAFGMGESWAHLKVGTALDLCYNLRPNEFNGSTTAQLNLCDIHPARE